MLIDEKGKQLGLIPTSEALELAIGKKLDLVEVASGGNSVVCKLLDYGRFSYREKKKRSEARSKQKQVLTKVVKFRPNTFEGDLKIKLDRIRRFLGAGDKVKAVMQFKGREIIHSAHGFELFARITQDLSEIGFVDSKPSSEGRFIYMTLMPHPSNRKEKPKANGKVVAQTK